MKKEVKDNLSKNPKRKKIIIISSIVVGLIIIIGISAFFITKNPNKDKFEYVDVEPTISMLEDGSYYIFGAPTNQSFEIEKEDGFTYEVKDEDNNKVEITEDKKDNKVILNGTYEEGKTYTLTIKNGTFTKEELKEAKSIVFAIERKSKQTAVLKDNIKEVSESDNKIEEKDNKITLTSKENYKTGDIVVIGEGINQSAYKVESVKGDTYEVSTPKLEEVYDELDYYGSTILNLEDFEANEEVSEYLIAYAEKNIVDYLIPKVNAASTTTIKSEWNKKDQALVAKVHVETNPNDKVFNKSFLKYHRLSFDYEVKLSYKLDYDISLTNIDVNLVVEVKNTPSMKLEHAEETLDNIKKGLEAYTKDVNVIKTLKSDYKNIATDKETLEQGVGKIVIPTAITGLNIESNINLIMDFDVKANMGATLTNTNTAVIGYSSKKGLYGSLTYKNNIDANVFGSASMRLGSKIDIGLNLMGVAKVNGSLTGGIYGKGDISINSKISNTEVTATLDANAEAGLFSTVKASASVLNYKGEKTFFDKELKLYDYTLPLKSTTKLKDTPVSSETNKNEQPTTQTQPSTQPSTTPSTPQKIKLNFYTYHKCSREDGNADLTEAIEVNYGSSLNDICKKVDKGGYSVYNYYFCGYTVAEFVPYYRDLANQFKAILNQQVKFENDHPGDFTRLDEYLELESEKQNLLYKMLQPDKNLIDFYNTKFTKNTDLLVEATGCGAY